MLGDTKQASSAKTSLIYLTVGALAVVWTVVYYMYLNRTGASDMAYLWVYGFFATGVVLIAIGLMVGFIGRAAMAAEVAPTPPEKVSVAERIHSGRPPRTMAMAMARPANAPISEEARLTLIEIQ